jgi:hypothetical protein
MPESFPTGNKKLAAIKEGELESFAQHLAKSREDIGKILPKIDWEKFERGESGPRIFLMGEMKKIVEDHYLFMPVWRFLSENSLSDEEKGESSIHDDLVRLCQEENPRRFVETFGRLCRQIGVL